MKQIIATNKAPAAVGPYSQGILVNGLLFTAGQVALTPTGEVINGTIEEETRQIMTNLKAILEQAGLGFEDVVKATIYLTDVSLFARVNQVYSESFPGEPYPARECVGVGTLPVPGTRVEISMVAARP